MTTSDPQTAEAFAAYQAWLTLRDRADRAELHLHRLVGALSEAQHARYAEATVAYDARREQWARQREEARRARDTEG
jgi:hypothetical protein